MVSEKEPLYTPLDDGENSYGDAIQLPRSNKFWKRSFFALLAVYIISLSITSGLIVKYSRFHECENHQWNTDVVDPYSPATGKFGYVNKFLANDPDMHKFVGKPRPEMDEAWHSLLEGTLLHITEDELQKSGNGTSIAYIDGGYAGGLGISHTLHCLKRIKQYMYPDYYYSGKDQDWAELEFHADHCLESIRQIALCHPDISLYTLEWTSHSRFKPSVRVPQQHSCVNWPELHGWMKDHAGQRSKMVPAPDYLYEDID